MRPGCTKEYISVGVWRLVRASTTGLNQQWSVIILQRDRQKCKSCACINLYKTGARTIIMCHRLQNPRTCVAVVDEYETVDFHQSSAKPNNGNTSVQIPRRQHLTAAGKKYNYSVWIDDIYFNRQTRVSCFTRITFVIIIPSNVCF